MWPYTPQHPNAPQCRCDPTAALKVPLDIVQLPTPILSPIASMTVSKFGLPVEEHQPRDLFDGKDFALQMTGKLSKLFLNVAPCLIAFPVPSGIALRPWRWKTWKVPLVSVERSYFYQDREDGGEATSFKVKMRFPKVTLLEFSTPYQNPCNPWEFRVDIIGGCLMSESTKKKTGRDSDERPAASSTSDRVGPVTSPTSENAPKSSLEGGSDCNENSPDLDCLIFNCRYLHRVPAKTLLPPSSSELATSTPPADNTDESITSDELARHKQDADFARSLGITPAAPHLNKDPEMLPTNEVAVFELQTRVAFHNKLEAPGTTRNDVVPPDANSAMATVWKPSSGASVWTLWSRQQFQQFVLGMLLRRFHIYCHDVLPGAFVAPLKPPTAE